MNPMYLGKRTREKKGALLALVVLRRGFGPSSSKLVRRNCHRVLS